MTYLAWAATCGLLLSYALVHRYGVKQFDVANVCGAVVLGVFNASLGAWQAVTLNVAFGLVAASHLVVRRHEPPTPASQSPRCIPLTHEAWTAWDDRMEVEGRWG